MSAASGDSVHMASPLRDGIQTFLKQKGDPEDRLLLPKFSFEIGRISNLDTGMIHIFPYPRLTGLFNLLTSILILSFLVNLLS